MLPAMGKILFCHSPICGEEPSPPLIYSRVLHTHAAVPVKIAKTCIVDPGMLLHSQSVQCFNSEGKTKAAP